MSSPNLNQYAKPNHALAYLARAENIPHRTEGESVVLEILPRNVKRVLDLGTGDGRLLALIKLNHPQAEGIALDFSSVMLTAARKRFADDTTTSVIEHNLEDPLPEWEGLMRLYPVLRFTTWTTSANMHCMRKSSIASRLAAYSATWNMFRRLLPVCMRTSCSL
jgi:SAM-dependent methyltransferase